MRCLSGGRFVVVSLADYFVNEIKKRGKIIILTIFTYAALC